MFFLNSILFKTIVHRAVGPDVGNRLHYHLAMQILYLEKDCDDFGKDNPRIKHSYLIFLSKDLHDNPCF